MQKSESDKVCLVAAGVTVYECKKAAEKLKAGGINVSIVDIFSVKPLDYEGIFWNKILYFFLLYHYKMK